MDLWTFIIADSIGMALGVFIGARIAAASHNYLWRIGFVFRFPQFKKELYSDRYLRIAKKYNKKANYLRKLVIENNEKADFFIKKCKKEYEKEEKIQKTV